MSDTDRIKRLERCLLAFMALVSGEAERAASNPEELEEFQNGLAKDCLAMRDDIC